MQKTIRRQLPEKALSTASALIQHHPKAFSRRLLIIALEDYLLYPMFPDLIRIMISVSRNQPLAPEDVSMLLTVVNDLCQVEVRDIVDRKLISGCSRSQPKPKFGPEATSLLDAIRTRLRFGGMREDMSMMLDLVKQWSIRFAEDKPYWLNFIGGCYPKPEKIEPNRVPPLKLNDLFIGRNQAELIVQNGKGGKMRVVRFDPQLKTHLKKYLKWKQSIGKTGPYLFFSDRRDMMCIVALENVFKRWCRLAGLAPHYSIHACRHTYGTMLYKASGNNLRLVQKMLGHASIVTTQIYSDVSDRDAEKVFSSDLYQTV